MLPTFPYMAMTITGVIHIVLGSLIFINCGISLIGNNEETRDIGYWPTQNNDYLGCVAAFSISTVIIGILGIMTGIKRKEHKTTHNLKVAYMVTSILSVLWFSSIEMGLYALGFDVLDARKFGLLGNICSLADYILSIVSASICCCCSNSTLSTNFEVFALLPPETYPHGKHHTKDYLPWADNPQKYISGTKPPPSYPVTLQSVVA